MLARFGYPVFLSVVGVLFFIGPFTARTNRVREEASKKIYKGSNRFFCTINDIELDNNASLIAEVSHTSNLFHLKLAIGCGNENRITFVIRDEEIKEGAYELDHSSKRYFSFLYHGPHCLYSSDENPTGMLMIHKYDTVNKIIAGSFEFMTYSDGCDELVRVRNGKFDATYTTKNLN